MAESSKGNERPAWFEALDDETKKVYEEGMVDGDIFTLPSFPEDPLGDYYREIYGDLGDPSAQQEERGKEPGRPKPD